MTEHAVDDLDSCGSTFYREAIGRLIQERIPFLVGGAYALQVHTGIIRRTKDFDIFVQRQDAMRVLDLFQSIGYNAELTFPHWLGKAFSGEDFIDVIFSSGNGACPVDELWFRHAARGKVLGFDLQLCPAEETIWQKSFILERDRCDVADVVHLIRHCGPRLDWQRLLDRFGESWPVLLAQLVLFRFVYPGHASAVPDWVMSELTSRVTRQQSPRAENNHICYGTLLSATQYLRDVELEKYRDGRLRPLGNLTDEDIAQWTANFMKPD